MIEIIREIPGPTFLFLYAFLVVAAIVLGRKWIDADGTRWRPLPDLAHYDPVTLAFLRGGINEVIRTVIFDLTQKELVKIKKKSGRLLLVTEGNASDLPVVGQEVFNSISRTPQHPAELMSNRRLKNSLDRHLSSTRYELERTHLYRTEPEIKTGKTRKAILVLPILGLGFTKLYLGLTFGRPVFFLFILMALSLFLLLSLLKVEKVTTLGKIYLQALERHFSWMKEELARGKSPDGYNPAMAVAIFGAVSLAAMPQYQAFAEAFPATSHSGSTTSADGSDCGGGCGASDDSGSGCGGGCGGCGGGGD